MTSPRTDALAQALFDFDGKRTAPLEHFAAAHSADASLIAELCDFAAGDDPNLQTAATWLLKRFGVTGAQLSTRQTERLLGLLIEESGWLPQIHILQMMDTLVLPAEMAAPLMKALRAQARGDNTFIRAWSLHGAVALAEQAPACRASVLDLLTEAERDDAASVRARIRKLRKAYGWLNTAPSR